MRHTLGVKYWIVTVALVLCMAGTAAWSQEPEEGVGAAQCNELQKQMDSIMAVYNSTMSDAEKLKSLTKIWMQAYAAMIKSTSEDSDMAEIAHEWKDTLEKLMGVGKASGGSGSESVSGDASTGLKIVKKRMAPYFQIVKMICPNVKIPDIATK